MKVCVTYPTYVSDLVEGVSKNVHHLSENLEARGIVTLDASPRIDVGAMNHKSVYVRQGLAALGRLQTAMADPEVDLLHYHVSIPGMSLWGALARARAPRRVPMVLHMWNPWFEPRDAHAHAGLERIYHRIFNSPLTAIPFLRAYDLIVVSSEYQRRQLAAHKVAQPVRVISNGVDLEGYRPAPTATTRRNARRELGLDVNATLLLYYGHLTPWKGVDVLLEALPRAFQGNPDAALVIARTHYGRGETAFRARLRALGLTSRVLFLGLCDVPLLLQAVDVGVVPATAAVGTACHPNVVLEYQAAGIPLVASRVGSIPEAVEDGTTGLLAQPGDPNDLGEKLATLLGQPDARARMARAARRRAERRYDWGRIAASYDRAFQEVLH